MAALPPVNVPPLLMKSPPSVSWKFPVASVAPLLIVSGTEVLKTFAASNVMAPVLAMITPPLATKGLIHSFELAVLELVVLYCKVAPEP